MKNKTSIVIPIFYLLFLFSFSQEYEMVSNGRLILGTYEERTASVSTGDIDSDGDIDGSGDGDGVDDMDDEDDGEHRNRQKYQWH